MYDFSPFPCISWEKCLPIVSGVTRVASLAGKVKQGGTREGDCCKIRNSIRGRDIPSFG